MRKLLNFSNNFFKTEYLENVLNLNIASYGILVNLDEKPLIIDKPGSLIKYKSYLLKNWEVKNNIAKAILISFDYDPARKNSELNKFCLESWDNNKKRYPDDPSKWNYKILRSPIEKINNLEFNCWYLPKETASSIHIEHPFKEIHTQLYGLGIMNKFKEQNYETLYQRMYMPPGFTHDFFFDKDVKYPWHQYEAVTDSIWMAIMEY
jgi:hypothetical protein